MLKRLYYNNNSNCFIKLLHRFERIKSMKSENKQSYIYNVTGILYEVRIYTTEEPLGNQIRRGELHKIFALVMYTSKKCTIFTLAKPRSLRMNNTSSLNQLILAHPKLGDANTADCKYTQR